MAQLQGWPEPYLRTVDDRITGHFPAKITVYAPYIPNIYLWFWPTLHISHFQGRQLQIQTI